MLGIAAKRSQLREALAAEIRFSDRGKSLAIFRMLLLFAFFLGGISSQISYGQMIDVGTPMNGFGSSWYERHGVGFGFSLPGGQWGGSRVIGLLPNGQFTPHGQLQFNQGSFGGTLPPFGGYDPNAAGRLGFGVAGSGGGFHLGFEFGKGSSRTITSSVPSLLVQNGSGGFIGSGQWTPFVTGWIPVVGNYTAPQSPDNAVTRAVQSGQLRLDNLGSRSSEDSASPSSGTAQAEGTMTRSTAEIASESVAAIRAAKAAEKESVKQRLEEQMAEYYQYLKAGNRELARLALVRAIPLETDPAQKQKLRELLKSTR